MDNIAFKTLIDYPTRIPSIQTPISFGSDNDGNWWVNF
ncbi:hypothetical protein GGQ60_000113 [Pedobacter zeae]|uniref:Uncharacterized protein n=1 Tax=Pedobacter zeae TaxID=1737356 RepID=A0A7W6K6J6_9SPHI|nr:hypothetical protein [Pedobacter zeae]